LIEQLPTLNAVLNSTSAVLLVAGYAAIRRRQRRLHAGLMLGALFTSLCFLVSYLVYHAHHGSTPYAREDWMRPLYFAILVTHSVLAAVNVPLVIVTVVRAAKRRFEAHRRIARWTLGVWLYVSVTGVVIYLMLYGL
jgi:putative membrane protein